MNEKSRITRLPLWAFILLCLVSSVVGFVILGVLAAATAMPDSIIALALLVGIVLPPIVLSLKRRTKPNGSDKAAQSSDHDSSRPLAFLKSRKVWIALLLGGLAMGLWDYYSPKRGSLGLELRADKGEAINGLYITNIAKTPIRILDVTINDRNDCTAFGVYGKFQEREFGMGDRTTVVSKCEILNATIKTNKGSATFSFK